MKMQKAIQVLSLSGESIILEDFLLINSKSKKNFVLPLLISLLFVDWRLFQKAQTFFVRLSLVAIWYQISILHVGSNEFEYLRY